jgi:hypothetical protein
LLRCLASLVTAALCRRRRPDARISESLKEGVSDEQ